MFFGRKAGCAFDVNRHLSVYEGMHELL